MKTESINKLSELFEIDRGTMVRALRNVPPDDERTTGRPTWKISTAASALMNHRANTGRADSRHRGGGGGNVDADWQDPLLTQLFAQQDEADRAMRDLPTLQGRRAAATAMVPLINRVDAAVRERGKANGLDADGVDLRADSLYMLLLRGLEAPCGWNQGQVWAAMSTEKVG